MHVSTQSGIYGLQFTTLIIMAYTNGCLAGISTTTIVFGFRPWAPHLELGTYYL